MEKSFHIIKAIPPKHPIQRLDSLERFAKEWLSTAFGFASKKTQHWSDKFTRNTERMRKRWEICGRDSEAPEGILMKKKRQEHTFIQVFLQVFKNFHSNNFSMKGMDMQ